MLKSHSGVKVNLTPSAQTDSTLTLLVVTMLFNAENNKLSFFFLHFFMLNSTLNQKRKHFLQKRLKALENNT